MILLKGSSLITRPKLGEFLSVLTGLLVSIVILLSTLVQSLTWLPQLSMHKTLLSRIALGSWFLEKKAISFWDPVLHTSWPEVKGHWTYNCFLIMSVVVFKPQIHRKFFHSCCVPPSLSYVWTLNSHWTCYGNWFLQVAIQFKFQLSWMCDLGHVNKKSIRN